MYFTINCLEGKLLFDMKRLKINFKHFCYDIHNLL